MNICQLANKSIKLVDYSVYGTTENIRLYDEFDIMDIILMFVITILVIMFITWWLAPIHIIINKYNLKDVRFKCNK